MSVELALESTKWAQIVEGVKKATDEHYQTPFLQKQAKILEANGGLAALPAEENESGDADDEVDAIAESIVKEEKESVEAEA